MLRIIDARRGDPLPEPSRFSIDPKVVEGARAICERVRDEGDRALVELTREHDRADIAGRIEVSEAEIDAAVRETPAELRDAIERMIGRLQDQHARQLPQPWEDERDGLRFGEVVSPVASAGCYVPGGRASYPSTVAMTVVPARVAGVERVVVCTPPTSDGSVSPAVLFAARAAGASTVYRVGGAQAVAALAFGTETIEAVDVVVGPGNVWVTAAKHEVAGTVGIDTLAGPTELVLVADATAEPGVLAVDLVAQAEHDPLARTVLVTWEPEVASRVAAALADEVAASPRREIVEAALARSVAVVVEDRVAAAKVVDRLAPEHLQVWAERPRDLLEGSPAFGAAFLGPSTPISFGDYGAGSNHVLPTMGAARFSSGLRASHFVTVSSVVEAGPGALEALGADVEMIAAAEGLPGHARASAVRR